MYRSRASSLLFSTSKIGRKCAVQHFRSRAPGLANLEYLLGNAECPGGGLLSLWNICHARRGKATENC